MPSVHSSKAIDVTQGFDGNVLGRVSMEDATKRLLAYCTTAGSGWATYDLTAVHLRRAGLFDVVSSWTLLYANALNGQVTLSNLADFDREKRAEFAQLISLVPPEVNLHQLKSDERAAATAVCQFGFPGVWGPKITKVGALFRPYSIPVLDGHVAQAFGFTRDAFSVAAEQRSLNRRGRIAAVLDALATGLADNASLLLELRDRLREAVPEISEVPDLRLLDMIIWTSQDDRSTSRRPRQGRRWIEREVGDRQNLDDCAPQPLMQA